MTTNGYGRRQFVATGLVGLATGIGGCQGVFGRSEGARSASFEFEYRAADRTVVLEHASGDRIPAGKLAVDASDGPQMRWSKLGSTVEQSDQPVESGSTARLGPSVVNWGHPVGRSETVRVLYVPDEESVTTLETFDPPMPTPSASPTATATETPTPTPTGPLWESDFEDGTLDEFAIETFPSGDDDTESYHITSDPSKGDHAVAHRTESRYLEPAEAVALEPPLTLTLDLYVSRMSGLDVVLQYDPEQNLGYVIKARSNFNGRLLEVGKKADRFAAADSVDQLSDRNEDDVFSLEEWERLRVTWSDEGAITATFDSTGEQVQISDDGLSGHTFRLVGYHYSGWAAFDNLRITRGLSDGR